MQHAEQVIREPLHDWVPIGEETEVVPILEPISRPPSYLPPLRSPNPLIDPELPGSPGKLDLANGWEKHHVFPRGGGILELYFQQKGINIHDFTVSIGVEQHKAIHRAGYNDDWWEIVTDPNFQALTKKDILRLGEKMKMKYGIIGPYEPW